MEDVDPNEEKLLNILPNSHQFELIKYEDCDADSNEVSDPNGFRAFFVIKFLNVKELEKWKSEFEKKTNTIYTRRNATSAGTIYTLKWILNCHRNTRGKSVKTNSKNTKCSSRLIIKMKRPYPGQEFHVTNIELDFVHNHKMTTNDILRFRKPEPKIVEKFKNLYSLGHSPNSALHAHMLDLMLEHPENFLSIVNDPSIVPDQRRIHYIKSIFQRESSVTSVDDIDVLKRLGSELSKQGGQMEVIKDGDQFAVAIVTPLMTRVSMTEAAGNVVFVNPGKGVDKTKIYLITTKSSIGELPLGAVVSSVDDETLLLSAFTCWKHLLPENGFGGRGSMRGPRVIVVENNGVEENALRRVWPDVQILYCTLHVLENVWRLLWDGKHISTRETRLHSMNFLKKIAFSETEEIMEETFLLLESDSSTADHPGFCQQINKLYKCKYLWAVCYRREQFCREFKKFSYSTLKIIKDIIFKRNKSFSIVQIVDFLIKRLELHYIKRLEAGAVNKSDGGFHFRHPYLTSFFSDENISKLGNEIYNVESLDSSFVVDVNLGVCSCSNATVVGVCKHIYAVLQTRDVSLNVSEALDVKERAHLYWLAHGTLPNNFVLITNNLENELSQSSPVETVCMVEILDPTNTGTEISNENQNQLNILATVTPLTSERATDKTFSLFYEVENNLNERLINVTEKETPDFSIVPINCTFDVQCSDSAYPDVSAAVTSDNIPADSLNDIFEDLKCEQKAKPGIYVPAVEEFKSTCLRMTDDNVASTLRSFGKRNKDSCDEMGPAPKKQKQIDWIPSEEIPSTEHCYSRQN
uniref:SWIM-type domain-containing protein n=1 Tax=Strigamia maritima TaxID=126957 RepID=T1IVH7_STRMM